MPRQPVDKAAPGYADFWRVMMGFDRDRVFTIRDVWLKVERANDSTKGTIRDYLNRLEGGGYVEKMAPADRSIGQPVHYRLLKTALDAPRLRKDGSEVTMGRNRESMWLTMKMSSSFTPMELSIASPHVKENDAKDYIKYLHRAGYLKLVSKAKSGCSQARYRLIPSKNTGPKPPQIQRVKQVFDPNLNEVVWREGDDA